MSIYSKSKRIINLIHNRPKGWLNFLINYLFAVIRVPYAPLTPISAIIEPTNICNLRCPVCETGAGILRREKGVMSFSNFKIIIDKMPKLNNIMLYFMGEPFLNKEIYKMISYAHNNNIFTSICTNGEYLNSDELLKSGLEEINFQIGGATQKTHSTYRVNGKLEKTINNLKELLEKRDKLIKNGHEIKIKITLGLIVMKQNENEINKVIEMGRSLGVDEINLIPPAVRNIEQAKEFMPEDEKYWFYNKDAFKKGILIPNVIPNNKCYFLWNATAIFWNGDVVPCCRDAQGDYIMGNILNDSIKSIWNNNKYKSFRKMVLKNQKDIQLCKLCSGYNADMKQ